MSDVLEVSPRGDPARAGASLSLHPHAGRVIKDEPGTLIWTETLPDGAEAVLKMYRRRGWLAWQRAGHGGGRAQREFEGLRRLDMHLIPCTPPLFWAVGQTAAQGRFELLATRHLPGSTCLRDVLRDEPGAGATLNLCPLFIDLARMHRGGLYHGALIPRNILVAPPGRTFHIMDLPRSIRYARDITGTRMARFDLLDLCQGLLRYCDPGALPTWLRAYGMPEPASRLFAAQAPRYASSKHLRNRLRGEFLLRRLFARSR